MPEINEKLIISPEELQKVGEWLKSTDISQERSKVINEHTISVINQMSFINPDQLKEPYTL
jgi:hypothetical protein